MLDPVLQAPDLKLAADSNQVLNYKRNANNYITQLFGEQLPAIRNGFFNAHMSKGYIVQPHWHTNVTEMVFVISGELITSVFDPFTQKLMTYHLKAGQISVFPKGWFHWILAESEHAQFLTIFDAPTPDIVYGSDFLRAVPKEVIQQAYCISEEDYAKAVAPLKESIILGPPPGCAVAGTAENSYPGANAQMMPNAAMPEAMYTNTANNASYANSANNVNNGSYANSANNANNGSYANNANNANNASTAKSMPSYTAQQPAAAFYPYPLYPRR